MSHALPRSTYASISKLSPISTKSFWIPKSVFDCYRELDERTPSFYGSDGTDEDGAAFRAHTLLCCCL
ncbi:hypothetical protein FF2_046076 [Malus domestica]